MAVSNRDPIAMKRYILIHMSINPALQKTYLEGNQIRFAIFGTCDDPSIGTWQRIYERSHFDLHPHLEL